MTPHLLSIPHTWPVSWARLSRATASWLASPSLSHYPRVIGYWQPITEFFTSASSVTLRQPTAPESLSMKRGMIIMLINVLRDMESRGTWPVEDGEEGEEAALALGAGDEPPLHLLTS